MKNQQFYTIAKVLILVLFALFLVTACGSKKVIAINENYPPKLIFLNYNIEKLENGKKSVKFINKIIADGKIKSNEYLENGVFGDLKCNQIDKNSNILQQVVLKNPLVKVIEYIDEAKKFQVKKIVLSNAEFSLRLKLEPYTKYVTVSEILQEGEKTELLLKTKIK